MEKDFQRVIRIRKEQTQDRWEIANKSRLIALKGPSILSLIIGSSKQALVIALIPVLGTLSSLRD